MYKFIFSTTLLFAWVFFEMSGGFDFEPNCRTCDTTAQSSPETPARTPNRKIPASFPVNSYAYVPFSSPIITPAKETPTTQTASASGMLIQASFSSGAGSAPQADQPRSNIRVVTGDWVNIRAGAGTTFAVIDTVPQGTEAELIEMRDNWAKVTLIESNETGWIVTWLLSD
ncbi:SH3 domain-containing protein [Loktanella sp. S4079]|uniref:SH3 domain-containing protein n=1 Tax=Loktanella sp. S4079 TaxID=579483 RepID=UPI0005F9CFAE|nr:SH3 domain-containing protein [Loktanella sp. S4079]KJZ17170.1 hypothetical protein TW80_17155 [Loktanella sp. S4079]